MSTPGRPGIGRTDGRPAGDSVPVSPLVPARPPALSELAPAARSGRGGLFTRGEQVRCLHHRVLSTDAPLQPVCEAMPATEVRQRSHHRQARLAGAAPHTGVVTAKQDAAAGPVGGPQSRRRHQVDQLDQTRVPAGGAVLGGRQSTVEVATVAAGARPPHTAGALVRDVDYADGVLVRTQRGAIAHTGAGVSRWEGEARGRGEGSGGETADLAGLVVVDAG